MNITKEKIDEIFLNVAEDKLLDINIQFINALENIADMKNNPCAREVLAASIAQGNVMAALKEVCYKLLLESE